MSIAELQHKFQVDLMPIVREFVQACLGDLPAWERTSLNTAQEVAKAGEAVMRECVYEVWKEQLLAISEAVGMICPNCGQRRRRRWRHQMPMKLGVMGQELEVPNLYLECRHCNNPGISIIKLLTGLNSGDASEEQKLAAAYCAAGHSYREASEALEVHHGPAIERMKVRRMALEIEESAMEFAKESRKSALNQLEEEGSSEDGPAVLILEADGGKVRTGYLQPVLSDEPGYGKKTAKRKVLRQKRPAVFREVITVDVREPGEIDASALDVMVPAQSEKGELSRRMLALATRRGMEENTEMIGLGDMGSGLANAFQEAFEAVNPSSRWYADWKHTRDYVYEASQALSGLDADNWGREMRQAIWDRDQTRRDELLEQAERDRDQARRDELLEQAKQRHGERLSTDEQEQPRSERLSTDEEKCPVHTLSTYLNNNWRHMYFAKLRARELPIVSARAEAQVRDRTKGRFSGPGVWRVENLEPKATLRSIIAEGRWKEFRAYHLGKTRELVHQELHDRLEQAVAQGRLQQERVSTTFALPAVTIESDRVENLAA